MGKALLYTFVPLIMLGVIAAGVILVRLRHGPISFDVVVPPIERGINAELVNNQVDIEGAELRLGSTGGLEFRLRNLSVLDKDGAVVATAPLSAVNISLPALWRARIVPERVILIDPEIHLSFTDETGLALSVTKLPTERPQVGGNDGSGHPDQPSTTVGQATPGSPKPVQPLNIAKMISDASARARRQLDASSYLTEFGMENVSVVLDYAGQRSSWRINEFSVDFNHRRKRSVISGRATIASQRGPWALTFLTDESEKSDRIAVKATIRDLVPSTLSAAAPPLALLNTFDLPIAGDATVEVSTGGEIAKAEIALQAGSGQIVLPGVSTDPFQLTAGLFRLFYDGEKRNWELAPSPVKWADGNIMFSGKAADISGDKGPPVWRFTLDGKNGTLEAGEFGVPPVALEQWSVLGSIIPRRGVIEVGDFRVKGGGGEVAMKGMSVAGPQGQSARAEVTVSPMPLATLKAMWPRALAPGAREWVGERVSQATFKGGNVRFASGEFMKDEGPAATPGIERLSATFEVGDVVAVPLDGMTQITAPRGLIRLENNALEVTLPDAYATVSGGRQVPIKTVRLVSPDVVGPRPDSELTLNIQSPLGPLLEVVESLPMRAVREAGPLPKDADGKVDAALKLKIPLVSGLKPDEVSVEGKARITDGRIGKVANQFDVQGFTLALDLTDSALDAKGDLLINGVPAKIVGQRILNGATDDQQPPLKITAKLDDADRTQLGLDINDLVHGTVPVDISLSKGPQAEPVIKLKANLTDAELMIDAIAWKKAAGRQATLEADIASGRTHKTELQNFKLAGDDIAVEGWVGIGADNKMNEFYFPEFTLNVVSRLEVQGTRGNDGIWKVKANGKTFDGRDFFRSLFTLNDAQKNKSGKPDAGIDLVADVDTVLGASDLALKGLKLKLSARSEKLVALDARGQLEGGAPLAAVLDNSNGTRRLLADSSDAGTTLKLVGFYPNIQGGRLRLEVNLDGKGPAEKTGTLWVENFKVLGDPIVSEVVGSADQGRPAIGRREVTREVFFFDRMRAPFSVGYGQFVLEDAYVRGPLMGANLTGKVDFKTRRINLGGTYIPLQGLNSALGGIPVLGQLISGTRGEGIFGITFGIQGDLNNPQVLVNPLSLVAPGIFREIFQMTNPNPKVQIRGDNNSLPPVEQRVRASAPPAKSNSRSKSGGSKNSGSAPVTVDGWSSTTQP
ncbi:MAG: AsmA-like C-terminal region-containing protein [Hyphomicrobiaceae bacterium]